MRRAFLSLSLTTALVVGSTTGAAATSSDADLVPADAEARLAAAAELADLESPWRDALQRAIDPDDYVCDPPPIQGWVDDEIAAVNLDALIAIAQLGALDWPTFYTLFFDHDASDEYIGVDGGETMEQQQRHRDAMRFWDVPTGDVLLQGMHGADIADDAKMVPVVQFLFGVDAATAQGIVDFVQSVIESEPTLDYDNPLFTLNAFAFSAEGETIPGIGLVPDKIVMGEGVIEFLRDIGLGGSGPDFVHAHEFAHHVQFEIGAFDSPLPPPEATRRTELMADGFAAYYLAHARGATLQAKRIVDAAGSAFAVGDCQFSNPGHHGTPLQREAAAEWGVDLARSARRQGHIIGSREMLERFEAVFPTLIAPDA